MKNYHELSIKSANYYAKSKFLSFSLCRNTIKRKPLDVENLIKEVKYTYDKKKLFAQKTTRSTNSIIVNNIF